MSHPFPKTQMPQLVKNIKMIIYLFIYLFICLFIYLFMIRIVSFKINIIINSRLSKGAVT